VIGRRNISIGPRLGPRLGLVGGGLTMGSVTRDATSLIYCPANATEWATTLAVAGIGSGGPSSVYLLQEPSGNAADAIGSFTLTAAGTLAYQQAVAGWTRKGIATTDATPGVLKTTSASLPDISTTSCAILAYVLLPVNGSASPGRVVTQLGAAFNTKVSSNLQGAPKAMQGIADPNTVAGTADNTNVVRPVWIQVNRTAGTATIATNLERLTPTLTAIPTGKLMYLGGDNASSEFPGSCTYLYAARFDGAAAELSTAQLRSLLSTTTLGWSIPW
jgi:hypothetical protein